MPRYTHVYSDFAQRLDEVEILLKQADQLERSRESFRRGPQISALCRSSVVLLSSHIEAYIKELGEHAIDCICSKSVCRSNLAPQFFYHVSKERIEAIRDTSQPEKIAKKVQSFINSDTVFWSRVGAFPHPVSSEDFNKGFSNPLFDKIKAYFGRFGYANFQQDFFRKLGRNAQTSVNNLDQIVLTRNAIAHGESSATKTPTEVKQMLQTAKIFCRTTDDVFGTWCRSNLCSIR